MRERTKVLLDTDIGDDIDDAMALCLALSSPEIELVGITTVTKNVMDRARLAKKLTVLAGRDIPVYAGYCDGIVERRDPYDYPESFAMYGGKPHMLQYTPDLESDEYAPLNRGEGLNGESAVDFIIDSCRRYGKDLIVCAIGPLSNLARAMKKDPEALSLAREVALMGGCYYRTFPEYNIKADAEAADMLVSPALDNVVCFGLEATEKLALSREQTETIMNYKGDPAAEWLGKLTRVWDEKIKVAPVLFDPVTLYYCADPTIAETEKMEVKVLTEGAGRGLTVNVGDWWKKLKRFDYGTVTVARSSDKERFIGEFMSRVFGAGKKA